MSEYKARREFLRTSFVANQQFLASRESVHETTENEIDDMYDHEHMENVALDDQQRMENIENNEQNMEIIGHDTTSSSEHIQFNNDNNTVSAEEISLVIYKKKDTKGRILKDFNILKEVDLLEQNLSLCIFAEDGNAQIHPNVNVTKTEFAEGYNELCEQTNTTVKNRRLIANFFHNTVGSVIDLPFTAKRKAAVLDKQDEDDWESDCTDESDSRSSARNLLKDSAIDNTSRYNIKQSRFFSFDQCPDDCTVFLGENKNLLHCPRCSLPRFRNCSKRKCKNKGGNSCAHLLRDGLSFK
jgi:hypothetical protein